MTLGQFLTKEKAVTLKWYFGNKLNFRKFFIPMRQSFDTVISFSWGETIIISRLDEADTCVCVFFLCRTELLARSHWQKMNELFQVGYSFYWYQLMRWNITSRRSKSLCKLGSQFLAKKCATDSSNHYLSEQFEKQHCSLFCTLQFIHKQPFQTFRLISVPVGFSLKLIGWFI